MEGIKEIFKDKNFNEETLKLIENFISEFGELFGKYVSRDEVIKRIKENLNENITFSKFEKEKTLGTYDSKDKRITLKENLKEDYIKAVFFHEMIHCITNRGDYVGFTGELEERTAKGITEGFTQYVSKIRNQKYGVFLNSYPILTEQTENLVELLGEEKFLEAAFNNPENVFDLMEEEALIEDSFDAEDFCECFDVIWKYEDEIYRGKTAEGRLLAAIFGRKSRWK